MRVLILGGSGMLGHKLWQTCSRRFDTYVTFRRTAASYSRFNLFDMDRAIGAVSAQEFDTVIRAFASVRPDVVVNCIGIVKQDARAKDLYSSIAVNALFPQRLAQLCCASQARLIQISTDCVFSGRIGNYKESDVPDAEDLYGRTKLLGEVDNENCVTIRTSMIGRELTSAHGLIEWFFSQRKGRVRGFKRAVFSGFTTNVLADIIISIISDHPDLQGVWHVASQPITKLDLLTLAKRAYQIDVEIEPDTAFVCDRSLNGTRFNDRTHFISPSWPEMIEAMSKDPTPYEEKATIDA